MLDRRHAAIAIGGSLGAALRWVVGVVIDSGGDFPWATFAVNVAGCGLLGFVLTAEWTHPQARLLLHDFAGIGFCGGLTTFSTFAVEIVDQVEDGRAALAITYIVASLVAGVAAFVGTGLLLRQVQALSLPLEEEP